MIVQIPPLLDLGEDGLEAVVLSSGLEAGQEVILTPLETAVDGMRVQRIER